MELIREIKRGTKEKLDEIAKDMEKSRRREEERDRNYKEVKKEIKNICKDWESRWKREEEEVKKKLKILEVRQKEGENGVRKKVREVVRRVERLELRREDKDGESMACGGERKMEGRMKELERKLEAQERNKRRNNIVIRGLKIKDEKGKEEIEKLLKEIEANVEVKEVKGIGGGEERIPRMWVVELGEEKEKWQVLEKKKNLKGKTIWIDLDRTERKKD